MLFRGGGGGSTPKQHGVAASRDTSAPSPPRAAGPAPDLSAVGAARQHEAVPPVVQVQALGRESVAPLPAENAQAATRDVGVKAPASLRRHTRHARVTPPLPPGGLAGPGRGRRRLDGARGREAPASSRSRVWGEMTSSGSWRRKGALSHRQTVPRFPGYLPGLPAGTSLGCWLLRHFVAGPALGQAGC